MGLVRAVISSCPPPLCLCSLLSRMTPPPHPSTITMSLQQHAHHVHKWPSSLLPSTFLFLGAITGKESNNTHQHRSSRCWYHWSTQLRQPPYIAMETAALTLFGLQFFVDNDNVGPSRLASEVAVVMMLKLQALLCPKMRPSSYEHTHHRYLIDKQQPMQMIIAPEMMALHPPCDHPRVNLLSYIASPMPTYI